MKVADKETFDSLLAADDQLIGMCVMLKRGQQEADDYFVVDGDALDDVARMTASITGILKAQNIITDEQYTKWRILWRKLVKNG